MNKKTLCLILNNDQESNMTRWSAEEAVHIRMLRSSVHVRLDRARKKPHWQVSGGDCG